MDVKIVNPFLAAAMHVLKTMAQVDAKPGKPFLKKDDPAIGDVSAIIGMTGAAKRSMALVFTEQCIKDIASNLLGAPFTELNHDERCQKAAAEDGFILQAGIPTIVGGKGHTIMHFTNGPRLAVPFETSQGAFMVEVAFGRQA